MLQCTIAGGRTKGANKKSFVFVHQHGGYDVTWKPPILGPALFLLFINDLPLVLKNNIGIYADDSTLYASAPTLAKVEEKIRPDIDAVSMWAKENKMKMHPEKTKYSIISTRQKIANSAKQSLDLSIDGMQLTKVESERVVSEQKHYTVYRNPELKQWGELSFIPLLMS